MTLLPALGISAAIFGVIFLILAVMSNKMPDSRRYPAATYLAFVGLSLSLGLMIILLIVDR